MGSKPSNNFQMDRPESGGADRNEEREASGLLDRDKQKFAASQARKTAGKDSRGRGASPGASDIISNRSRGVAKGKPKKNR